MRRRLHLCARKLGSSTTYATHQFCKHTVLYLCALQFSPSKKGLYPDHYAGLGDTKMRNVLLAKLQIAKSCIKIVVPWPLRQLFRYRALPAACTCIFRAVAVNSVPHSYNHGVSDLKTVHVTSQASGIRSEGSTPHSWVGCSQLFSTFQVLALGWALEREDDTKEMKGLPTTSKEHM